MTPPLPSGADRPVPDDPGVVAGAGPTSARIGNLRGAGVEADVGRIGRVVVALGLVALTVVVVVLFVAGANKNAQITRLQTQGVHVDVTVTGCLGQLGGSGSNGAGYSCRGTFIVNGHRYNEALPGNSLLPPGTAVRGIVVPSDPALVSSAGAVAAEHASSKVFLLPTLLLVLLIVSVGVLALRQRRLRRPG